MDTLKKNKINTESVIQDANLQTGVAGILVDKKMVPAVISLIKKLGYNLTDTFNLDMFRLF